MNQPKFLMLLALSILSVPASQAAGDATKGKALSGACTSCHGNYGLSNSETYPNLAGQKQAYLVKALQQYQAGQRSDLTMQAEAGPLSAQDIENLAAYFASNAIIPSYSTEPRILHIPYVGVGAEFYQGDLQYLQDSSFKLITINPVK